jgi:WW domain-containing oxidoreductase
MSLLARIRSAGPNRLGYGSTAEQATSGLDLSGKTYLLTGCRAGLGKETLRVLSLRGGHVIATARTQQQAQATIAELAVNATAVECELSEPASVRRCVNAVKASGRSLDAIVCNAGIMALPKLQQRLGYELQFFTNHIGHFILVTELLDALAAAGRVVMVSSGAHKSAPAGGIQFENLSGERGYSPWRAYAQSKLCNLLFARQLAKRLVGTQRTANALHPGVIRTELARHMNPLARVGLAVGGPLLLKSIAQGAATQCYLAADPQLATVSGQYFADCNVARSSRHGEDDGLAERLWETSEAIVAKLS